MGARASRPSAPPVFRRPEIARSRAVVPSALVSARAPATANRRLKREFCASLGSSPSAREGFARGRRTETGAGAGGPGWGRGATHRDVARVQTRVADPPASGGVGVRIEPRIDRSNWRCRRSVDGVRGSETHRPIAKRGSSSREKFKPGPPLTLAPRASFAVVRHDRGGGPRGNAPDRARPARRLVQRREGGVQGPRGYLRGELQSDHGDGGGAGGEREEQRRGARSSKTRVARRPPALRPSAPLVGARRRARALARRARHHRSSATAPGPPDPRSPLRSGRVSSLRSGLTRAPVPPPRPPPPSSSRRTSSLSSRRARATTSAARTSTPWTGGTSARPRAPISRRVWTPPRTRNSCRGASRRAPRTRTSTPPPTPPARRSATRSPRPAAATPARPTTARTRT